MFKTYVLRSLGLSSILGFLAGGCGGSTPAQASAPPRHESLAATTPRVDAPPTPAVAVEAEAPPPPPAAPSASTPSPSAHHASAGETAASTFDSVPPSTAVLHIGDSFTLAGFSQALRPRLKALRARYEVRAETSSYTPTWAAKMKLLVANTQPDLVIITLGANEVGTPKPEVHAYAVREIVREIGGRPCVWVSPPLWREDTGMVEMIRDNSAPCRFFDSDKLVDAPIPRQKDKIHPTPAGGAIWADAFWRWLETERVGGVDASGKPRPWALRPAPNGEHGPGFARE